MRLLPDQGLAARAGRRIANAGRTLLYLIEAVPFFLLIGIFRLMPVDAASAAGGWLGRRLGWLLPWNRRARNNLEAAFPERTPAQINEILRGMWTNLGRTAAEYAHFAAFSGPHNPRFQVEGLEHLVAAQADNKGLILVSGHFANWELSPLAAHNYGIDGATVYRTVNNLFVGRWIQAQRRRYTFRQQIPRSKEGAREMLRVLKENRALGLLVDQKSWEGVPLPFMGRPALTVTGPAVLSLRTGAPIVPVSIERMRGARFLFRVDPPLRVTAAEDKKDVIETTTAALNRFLEDRIRARPEQWLWIHRRWVDVPQDAAVNPVEASRLQPVADQAAPGTS